MFEREKVLHTIGRLLKLNGGKMDHLKLMKELYLIDRESFAERNSSVSGDSHVSMERGPVLSTTYFILNDLRNEGCKDPWADYLNIEDPYIVMKKDIDDDMLSARDERYIEKIFNQFKYYDSNAIVAYTHELPEWKTTYSSSVKIKFAEIMRALGKTDEEIEFYKEQYRNISDMYEKLNQYEKKETK